ncbi:hypothetical protein HB779_24305 (plasmid) [Phyllobacterium sp. 628]|uniref:hypothetical protein n=1 Tax=Phyllobacterium sp. 628 TaxID=2718938 RepID=UPI00166230FE|nr:hypothetical protein [Phyllobacterium sp. 628]QND54718.1 hypothetical protein HB779_24305 [Phyllobacterium sp. 628]
MARWNSNNISKLTRLLSNIARRRRMARTEQHIKELPEYILRDIGWPDAYAERLETEPVRIDPYTKRAFTFFADPDGLPIEIYEVS